MYVHAYLTVRMQVFRGMAWVRLLDDFVEHVGFGGCDVNRWKLNAFVHKMAQDVLRLFAWPTNKKTTVVVDEHKHVPTVRLPSTTMIAALHRKSLNAEAWLNMHHILQMESSFLVAIGGFPHGIGHAITSALSVTGGMLRAWPVCLRKAAVWHIQHRVWSGGLIPLSPRVVLDDRQCMSRDEQLEIIVEWLRVVVKGANTDLDETRLQTIRNRVAESLPAEWEMSSPAQWDRDSLELDETKLQRWAETRYGVATEADWHRIEGHFQKLANLIIQASKFGREHWTEAQRRAYDHCPDESRQSIKQDIMLISNDDYLAECARDLTRIVHDPLVDPDNAHSIITGDSHLRPRTLYPEDVGC